MPTGPLFMGLLGLSNKFYCHMFSETGSHAHVYIPGVGSVLVGILLVDITIHPRVLHVKSYASYWAGMPRTGVSS